MVVLKSPSTIRTGLRGLARGLRQSLALTRPGRVETMRESGREASAETWRRAEQDPFWEWGVRRD